VIGKISAPRGKRVEPLIRYLFGPGRREEHSDAHVVAGWRHPAELEPPLRAGGARDLRKLNGLLNQPNDARGSFAFERPVWHCALRAAPEDKTLSDDEWAAIAHDVMNRTGLSRYGEEGEGVRWIAVRHASGHIHLVAMLARQDGRRPSLSNERYRVRDACRAAERAYGLRSTAPADRTAPRRPTRAESEKAARRGLEEAPRVTLRRAVTTASAVSSTAAEFFARLDAAGITVRQRHSAKSPRQVTGYSVALPGDVTKDGSLIWYSGGKLAADLSWPKLAQRWAGSGPAPARPVVTAAERIAIWDHAGRVAADAAARIRVLAGTDPARAADAAWAASDTLHAAAAALGSRTLRQAADAYDRAARVPFGRVPARSPAGDRLRHSARLLGALSYLSRDPANAPLVILIQLATLAEAVADLREAQRHAAQAAAALAAAKHLNTAARTAIPRPAAPARPATAAQLAATAFPKATPGRKPAAGPPRPGQDPSRPARRPPPPRPRGPAR
jgi:MobA/VirD2-like, nuclease domain